MIYVSPNGNDSWSGLQHAPNQEGTDGPFATLEKARNTIRELKRSGSLPQTEIAIYLREGDYALSDTFLLTDLDSGTEQAPIVYRAFQNETVQITSANQQSTPLVQIQNGQHISIEDLVLANTNGPGLALNGTEHLQVHNCEIHHTGDSAIQISGGDRKTLARSNHTINNNHIHNIALGSQAPSIKISGVGISVTHNHIYDSSGPAIEISGNEHTISHNHIHNVSLTLPKKGAIYMARDWTERGIRIQHNWIHDLNSPGVHMDDCASGSVIIGNIFARCSQAILLGGGRNHRAENNIFTQCELAIEIDGRGMDEASQWRDLIYNTLRSSFDAVSPLESPYSDRYPELQEIAIYYQDEIGIPPEGNLIVRNICHASTWLKIHWHAQQKDIAIQNNVTDEDPLFHNPANDDYTLHEDSPAYEIGFKPIPVDQIGP